MKLESSTKGRLNCFKRDFALERRLEIDKLNSH